jgi:hypothetical protein
MGRGNTEERSAVVGKLLRDGMVVVRRSRREKTLWRRFAGGGGGRVTGVRGYLDEGMPGCEESWWS